jgi:hypothetical protein|uniref:Uncharacterized protein n=1 Tax=Siphoviridae sp. cteLh2 TaxID=2825590 RepID=A0A8S5U5Y8_9CAUD|nr:hypothetical protein [uncultured Lachnoclostridium sp.]DAF89860.1 MAG TPA: hypothetical protein [Siphoviridae sp. cteLh2]
MFQINGYEIKDSKEYLAHPRTKVTTTIRSEYYSEYRKLMNSINRDMCKGWDILIELLSEDEDLLEEFITRVRKY